MKSKMVGGMGGALFAFLLVMSIFWLVERLATLPPPPYKAELAVPLVGTPAAGVLVPSPVSTIEWSSIVGGVYGDGRADQGLAALEFTFDTRSPVFNTGMARQYIGNRISGQFMPTQDVTTSPPYTFTAGLNDWDAPDHITWTVDCPVIPFGTTVYSDYLRIDGVVTNVDCGFTGSKAPCHWQAHVNTLGGQRCQP